MFGLAEMFSIDPQYSTSFVTSDEDGVLDYGDKFDIYEMVDDNDDQDRRPDWRRKGWSPGDDEVFPGWDENNDLISDFNQNDNEDRPNLIPDYEEPFLRFHADRPEFLYGTDMNHNGTVDRFENDEEPDYPYKRDREGYNLFAGAYAIVAADIDHFRWGRWRLFEDLRRVRDTIEDDLLQWLQPAGSRGTLQLVEDQLPARDTWINTTWLGWNQKVSAKLEHSHKIKWQWYYQLDDKLDLRFRGIRRDGSFLGMINKVEYVWDLGRWTFVPRWKSEF